MTVDGLAIATGQGVTFHVKQLQLEKEPASEIGTGIGTGPDGSGRKVAGG